VNDRPTPRLTVVIPMFNEQDALPAMVRRLRPVLDGLGVGYEVVAVDDGSIDATFPLLDRLRRDWPQVRVIRLRRNGGHQAALTAGMSVAGGDYVVSMDADLQDPPEKIPEMLALAERDDLDIVYGVRIDRSQDRIGKRITAGLYYRLMRRLVGPRLPLGAGDFRLLSRRTVEALRQLPEHQPVYRMLVPWIGFPSGQIGYIREQRVAGRTKYPFGKMVKLAGDSIANFSAAPLRVATWLGVVGFVLAGVIFVGSVVAFLVGYTVPGWTSLFGAVVVLGATQLLCLGLLGEYVGRIYSAVQGRPAYFVGYDSGPTAAPPEGADSTLARVTTRVPSPHDGADSAAGHAEAGASSVVGSAGNGYAGRPSSTASSQER
jgi:polyisoprenyl-phosphate glycosyltransferase